MMKELGYNVIKIGNTQFITKKDKGQIYFVVDVIIIGEYKVDKEFLHRNLIEEYTKTFIKDRDNAAEFLYSK